MQTRIEIELVSREVELIRAALHFYGRPPNPYPRIYEQIARKMKPVGIYRFQLLETACIMLALVQYAETVREACGRWGHAKEAVDLADDLFKLWLRTSTSDQVRKLNQSIPPIVATTHFKQKRRNAL